MPIQQNVSTLSIVFMSVSIFLSIILPVGVIVFLAIRKIMKWKAMLIGALMFVLFVFILESLMHRFVLGASPAQSPIYRNTILYMLYGGFAAGIFEEVARLIGFKFLIKVNDNEGINTGISYGLGHGGIEAVFIGGLSAVGNLIMAVMINSGTLGSVSAALSGAELESYKAGVEALTSTSPYLFLFSGVERVIALVLQISLSLFVLKAIVEKKWQYFVLAILLHAGVDMFAVLYQKEVISSVYLLEGALAVVTLVIAIAAFRCCRRKSSH